VIKLTLHSGKSIYVHFDAVTVMEQTDDGCIVYAGPGAFRVRESVQDVIMEMAQHAVDQVCEEAGAEDMTRQ